MRILYLTDNQEDYMADLLLHGISSSFEFDIDLANKKSYLDKNFPLLDTKSLLGRGFTFTRLIDYTNINLVSNKKIKYNIRNNIYDVIIFAEIHKFNKYFFYCLLFKRKCIVIDGEDDQFFNITRQFFVYSIFYTLKNLRLAPAFKFYFLTKLLFKLHNKMLFFFKRELLEGQNAFPISFAIPKEKICRVKVEKTHMLSLLIPGIRETYVFSDEKDYYHNYNSSFFGLTWKKGGWDCLRHYEILANNCIPYFPDLMNCPKTTMHNFPKELVLKANKIYQSDLSRWNLEDYNQLNTKLKEYTLENLTTEKLAQYVLSKRS